MCDLCHCCCRPAVNPLDNDGFALHPIIVKGRSAAFSVGVPWCVSKGSRFLGAKLEFLVACTLPYCQCYAFNRACLRQTGVVPNHKANAVRTQNTSHTIFVATPLDHTNLSLHARVGHVGVPPLAARTIAPDQDTCSGACTTA